MLRVSGAVREPLERVCASLGGRGLFRALAVCASLSLLLVSATGALGSTSKAKKKTRKASPAARAITEFPIPAGIARPGAIVVGPGGNLWFTQTHTNAVGLVTPAGKFKVFVLRNAGSPTGIALGADGNLWFTESSSIGRITPSGAITEFPIPAQPPGPGEQYAGSGPLAIAAGPDGNLWFTEWLGGRVGRITPAGAISQFVIPTSVSHPYGITAGPDGNLWFTEENGDKIGRITTSGAITEFPTPAAGFPYGITAGRDGNLWFTEYTGDRIGRITPSGAITEFPIPTPMSYPSYGITPGREGDLWFTEESAEKIARITPAGKISEYPLSTTEARPTSIVATANGNLWFTELFGNNVGRVVPGLLRCVVPNLKGTTLAKAKLLLAHAECTLGRVLGHGRKVASQSPAAKKKLPYGASVGLRLG